MCHQTSASRVLQGPSGSEPLSWNVKRLSCGSFVVELTLPIAHKPAAKLRSLRHILRRLGLDTLRLLTSQLLAEIMAKPLWTATALSLLRTSLHKHKRSGQCCRAESL